jgi:hypothetical protein
MIESIILNFVCTHLGFIVLKFVLSRHIIKRYNVSFQYKPILCFTLAYLLQYLVPKLRFSQSPIIIYCIIYRYEKSVFCRLVWPTYLINPFRTHPLCYYTFQVLLICVHSIWSKIVTHPLL